MISALISRLIILSFGTLYPAYASYKAVRTKSVKEYVKWMMYWIVYAFFTCFETVTDTFFSWFPFYYEVKVVIVLWLLSPATKGSSTLYRKFVHPALARHEQHIDEYLNQAKERGYTAVVQLGAKGVNYATNVIMQTAIKGGGNLVQTIRRSYSLSDLSEPDVHRTPNEVDEVLLSGLPLQAQLQQQIQPRLLRNRLPASIGQQHQHRSTSGTRHSTGMYYTETETDLVMTAKAINEYYNTVRYPSDISSGYSSAADTTSIGLSRTASMSSTSKQHRIKPKRQEYVEMQLIPYQRQQRQHRQHEQFVMSHEMKNISQNVKEENAANDSSPGDLDNSNSSNNNNNNNNNNSYNTNNSDDSDELYFETHTNVLPKYNADDDDDVDFESSYEETDSYCHSHCTNENQNNNDNIYNIIIKGRSTYVHKKGKAPNPPPTTTITTTSNENLSTPAQATESTTMMLVKHPKNNEHNSSTQSLQLSIETDI